VEKGTLRFDMMPRPASTELSVAPDVVDRWPTREEVLAQGGGLPNDDPQKVIEESRPRFAKTATRQRQEDVPGTCAKCHSTAARGQRDRPGLRVRRPPKEDMGSPFSTMRSVEGNFQRIAYGSTDGRPILGILGAQTGTSV